MAVVVVVVVVVLVVVVVSGYSCSGRTTFQIAFYAACSTEVACATSSLCVSGSP